MAVRSLVAPLDVVDEAAPLADALRVFFGDGDSDGGGERGGEGELGDGQRAAALIVVASAAEEGADSAPPLLLRGLITAESAGRAEALGRLSGLSIS